MATRTTIDVRGVKYTLSLYYVSEEQMYYVTFASQSRFCNKTSCKSFTTFGKAWDNYSKNYRFYTGKSPTRITEEEFHNLKGGTLYPAAKQEDKNEASA